MVSDSQKEGLKYAGQLLSHLQDECRFSNFVKNEVMRIYWGLLNSKGTYGFTRKRLIASLTYYICNREGHGTSMQEIAKIVGLDRYKLFKTLKKIKRRLSLPNIVPSIDGLIIKHGNQLGMREETITHAVKLSKKIKSKLMNNPLVIAGTCLYLAGLHTKDHRSVQVITRKLNISESTIYSLKRRLINEL